MDIRRNLLNNKIGIMLPPGSRVPLPAPILAKSLRKSSGTMSLASLFLGFVPWFWRPRTVSTADRRPYRALSLPRCVSKLCHRQGSMLHLPPAVSSDISLSQLFFLFQCPLIADVVVAGRQSSGTERPPTTWSSVASRFLCLLLKECLISNSLRSPTLSSPDLPLSLSPVLTSVLFPSLIQLSCMLGGARRVLL